MFQDKKDFAAEREKMVEAQIARRGITSPRVLEAFRSVPRHQFVPRGRQDHAYEDRPLPIGEDQTISQPYIVAYMTEKLALRNKDKVLEIGTGSGYQAAILAELAGEVYTVERHRSLAESTAEKLKRMGYENIQVFLRDGTLGLPEHSPYDAIIVTASAPEIPQALLDQLAEGGRLIMPIGGRRGQVLKLSTKKEGEISTEMLSPVAFVPLIGDQGWDSP